MYVISLEVYTVLEGTEERLKTKEENFNRQFSTFSLRQLKIKNYSQTFGRLQNHIPKSPGTRWDFGKRPPCRRSDAIRIRILRPMATTPNFLSVETKYTCITPSNIGSYQDVVVLHWSPDIEVGAYREINDHRLNPKSSRCWKRRCTARHAQIPTLFLQWWTLKLHYAPPKIRSLNMAQMDEKDSLLILEWEVALIDESQLWSGELAAAADDYANVEHESLSQRRRGKWSKKCWTML